MKEAEEPFSAALLQDMAVPLLAKEAPAAYAKLLSTRKDGKVRLSALEKHVFGWTHAEAAGIMARQWNLPEGFAVLIENHLEIQRWVEEASTEPGKLAVAMSALLPPASDSTWTECGRLEECYEKVRPEGGPPMTELLGQVDEEFVDFAPVLKLSAPSKLLVDSYNEVAPSAT
jgi:hypothetical protein